MRTTKNLHPSKIKGKDRSDWRRLGPVLVVSLLPLLLLAPNRLAGQDLPPPPSNPQLITSGSLVIPMDNDKQNLLAPFNLKAYGLVSDLLQNDIPVRWAIAAGKAKDGIDFTAGAKRVAPSPIGSSLRR